MITKLTERFNNFIYDIARTAAHQALESYLYRSARQPRRVDMMFQGTVKDGTLVQPFLEMQSVEFHPGDVVWTMTPQSRIEAGMQVMVSGAQLTNLYVGNCISTIILGHTGGMVASTRHPCEVGNQIRVQMRVPS
jgi:hypothetical protein